MIKMLRALCENSRRILTKCWGGITSSQLKRPMTNTPETIACLGWGSLVWDPDGLPIEQTNPVEQAWHLDGPALPVEFARHSGGNRMTLVLVPGRRLVSVLWTKLLVPDLATAKRSLAMRECRRKDGLPVQERTTQRFLVDFCGYWTEAESRGQFAQLIGQWAHSRGLFAVVWTDLPTKFEGVESRVPTAAQVIEFLRGREGQELQDAKDYVTKAPRQIATEYRKEIVRELGWLPTSIL
jgi:cation transport regulator ChaC